MLENPSLWNPLQEAVKSLALRAGYVGAGTAEFIYDQTTQEFYFLEVNARLQVEHPVTEAVTGLDLVEWQLRVASGEELMLGEALMAGNRDAIHGHAIEVRIIAEDPAQGFMPSIGKILAWAEPRGIGVRVDTGFEAGSEVSRFYDSMLAKLIVQADTRAKAIHKLSLSLEDFHILGVKTNIGYTLDILAHSDFQAGNFDTGFLERELSDWRPPTELPNELWELTQAATQGTSSQVAGATAVGAWDLADGFRLHR